MKYFQNFVEVFRKTKFPKNVEDFWFFNAFEEGTLKWAYACCGLLHEFPAETRLTVYRRLDIPNRNVFEKSAPDQIRDFGREHLDLTDASHLSY